MKIFKPATDVELNQYIEELSYWKSALKNYQPEKIDYFELFKDELPEIVEEKLKELKLVVREMSEVLLMAEEKMKICKNWFLKMMFKIWVYDVANERFIKTYKELKRFYWLEKRLKGTIFNSQMTPEQFKEANPIWDTIERYVPINSRGFAKCPFHNEKTASMKIYKNGFYCFGCQENGDIISFLMKMHNKTFKEILDGKTKF